VYHLLVPSQLKRFIEMAFESGTDAFRGKYAAALMTSIHTMTILRGIKYTR
jgi:hypothetical protein